MPQFSFSRDFLLKRRKCHLFRWYYRCRVFRHAHQTLHRASRQPRCTAYLLEVARHETQIRVTREFPQSGSIFGHCFGNFRDSFLFVKLWAPRRIQVEEGDKVPYGSGPLIAEEMIREGLRWCPSDRSAGARVAGKNRLHEVLKVDDYTDQRGLIILSTCRQILADLPVIPSNPSGSDDIDSRYASDHS